MGKMDKFLNNFFDHLVKPDVIFYLATSVGSTLLNKWILDGLDFPALCLAAIHFIIIFFMTQLGSWCSFTLVKKQQSYATLIILSSIACLNRIFMLLSMYENTLIVFVVSKTLTIPFILLTKEIMGKELEKLSSKVLYKKYIPLKMMILGGFLVFSRDVESRGFLYMLFHILNSAIYQTVSGNKRGKVHGSRISAMYYQSPLAAAITVILIGCTNSYHVVKNCYWAPMEWGLILLSGILAYFSHYNCLHVLDKTDALTFNVLTQLKTALVLVLSNYTLPECVSNMQYIGLLLNIVGGITITYFRHQLEIFMTMKNNNATCRLRKTSSPRLACSL